MYCFIDSTTDPYYNLAVEEYLLREYDKPVFRLWRNDTSIIIGRNQNAMAEIDSDYVHKHNIPVVRRLSGGGAVFHDLGNINYTFIDQRIKGEDTSAMFRRFTAPIIEALKRIGVNAYMEGRNDILIDGQKFSGNAICVWKNRVLQHGTLLFSSSINDLSEALLSRPEKFIDKAVKSHQTRVTNISDHLPEGVKGSMTPEGFIDYLQGYVMSKGREYSIFNYHKTDLDRINILRDTKYSTDEWNYGQAPKYQFTNSIKLPCGLVEVSLDVDKGLITKCHISGDYFFTRDTQEISEALIGVQHIYNEVYPLLKKYPLKEYFGADITEKLCRLICD